MTCSRPCRKPTCCIERRSTRTTRHKAQVALRNRQAAVDRLAEVQRQLEGLRVYAPVAGHIVARNLHNTIGTYVHEGAELLAVGDERRKELLVSVVARASR